MVAAPLLVVLGVAQAVLRGQTVLDNSSGHGLTGFDPLTLGFVSIVVLSILFYELKRHGERTAKILMAGVTMSGTLAGLVLLQAWFEEANAGLGVFFLLAPPVAYVGLYLSFRDYTGSLSRRRAGFLRAGSATLLGSVLGALLPVLFTVPFLVLLSILDLFFIDNKVLGRTVGTKALDELINATTLPLAGLDIGLGDLMAYSMLATTSIIHSGIYAALATTGLILAGVLVTFQVARSRFVVPGLPIPLWLGMAPTLIVLLLP